jgi:hypothetical protein
MSRDDVESIPSLHDNNDSSLGDAPGDDEVRPVMTTLAFQVLVIQLVMIASQVWVIHLVVPKITFQVWILHLVMIASLVRVIYLVMMVTKMSFPI